MAMSSQYKRLDVYMADNSFCASREIAKKLITSGSVEVDGVCVTKPSFQVNSDNLIIVTENEVTRYVSRGALKLERALDVFNIDVKDMIAVDFGASTGGFTDVLLQRGASRVYAIENGSGQLHPKLRSDNRVVSYENTNARYIEKGFIPLCDIAVMDVSFISQTKLYNSVKNVLKKGGTFVSLVKPQFEAGKAFVSKNGIVKDAKIHKRVVDNVTAEAALYGLKVVSVVESPILGGDGNKEFLAYYIYEG